MLSHDPILEEPLTDLHRERMMRQVLFDNLSEGILVLDSSGHILEANAAILALIDQPLSELLHQPFERVFRLIEEQSRIPILNPIQVALSPEHHGNDTCWILETHHRTEIALHLTATRLTIEPQVTVVIIRDMTTSRNLSRQLQWQARHDPITGLVNRLCFEESLAQVLDHPSQEPSSHVLAQLDIDHFKVINDTCGHLAGDQLLGQLAVILQEQVRSGDLVARLGGDEFGILFRNCSLSEAHTIVRQLLNALKAYKYRWKGKGFAVEMSIGLLLLERDTQNVEAALSKVDTACYTAKNRGKSRIHVFSSRDVEVEDLKRHQEWHLLVREALEEGRFSLYRQPIKAIDHVAAHPQHYEVLLRMVGADGQLIAPNRFIPTAERYHLMPMIDQWVVGQCLGYLAQKYNTTNSKVTSAPIHSINLSGDSLNDDQFLQSLMKQVAECNIVPSQICFEITETSAIVNLPQVNDFMQALKQMGCLFSLDDFGAGMSSFGYLSALPVDFVKIDGKFVQDIELDSSNVTIVESIVHVSKSLGLKTIAEWVERESTAYRLKNLGVDYIQGFGVGRPAHWI